MLITKTKLYIYIYMWVLYFFLFKKKKFTFKKKNFFLKKKFFSYYHIYLFIYFKIKQYCFFKKRLLLIKFWKNFFKKIIKLFYRKNFNHYFFYLKFNFNSKVKNPNFLYVKNHLFLKFFYYKLLFHLNFKKLKYKLLWNIYLRKFNNLKKYFLANLKQFFFIPIHLYQYKKIFLIFQFYSNINFFLLIFYQLKNIFFKICFFFNWHISLIYLKLKGIFLDGLYCCNYLYFCNPYKFITYQLIWVNKFFFIYCVWYNYYCWQVSQIAKINWLYFFRRYIQHKTYRLFLPKWIYKLHNFYWGIPLFLEVSFITLSFFLLPIYFNLFNTFFTRYFNIYNHRLYLWKYII